MGLKVTVVRKPSGEQIYKRMLAAIRKEWRDMDKDVDKTLREPVRDWKEGPEFYMWMAVKPGKWRYRKSHRSKKTGGQRYNWVRLGTGLHGPRKQAYAIFPKQAGGVLRFSTPHSPKTLAPGQSRPSGPGGVVFTRFVNKPGQTHPGIKPRNDTKGFPGDVYRRLFVDKGARNGFLQRTRAAAVRSFKKR